MANNEIWLDFADGEYRFYLGLEQIDELQRKCGVGIGGLLARLSKGRTFDPINLRFTLDPFLSDFYAIDIIETLRQGLIGGGKGKVNEIEIEIKASLADKLIKNYVLTKPLGEHWNEALSVLGACIMGYDPPKDEPAGERATETEEMTATSTSS
jgi:hypothetical protein